jgi:O-antigen/teichoic acid export membrane protein
VTLEESAKSERTLRKQRTARRGAHAAPRVARAEPERRPPATPTNAGPGRAAGGGGSPRLAEVARGGSLNLVGAAVAAVTTLGVALIVTRVFSKPVAGAFFAAISLFMIVESVASLCAYTGLVYFIARLRLLGVESRIKAILRAAIIPVVVASVAGAAALFLFARPLGGLLVGDHYDSGGSSPAAVATALRALAVVLPFAALQDTLLGASRGYRDMRPSVVIDKLSRSAAQMAGVAVAAVLGTAGLLAPLWVVPYIPAAAAAWIWLRKLRGKKGAGPPRRSITGEFVRSVPAFAAALDETLPLPDPRLTDYEWLANANPRGFWRFTTPRAFANLAQAIIQRLDIVLVAIMRGPVEAAIYTAATRFLVVGQYGNTAIALAAQPRFTELFATGDRRGARIVYQMTTAWLIILTWPLYLLSIVYGPEFLAIFGHSYRAGYPVMVILGAAMLLSMACGQVDMVLITTGRSSWSLANGLLSVGVNVGVDLALIPRHGIIGAAIGWAASIVVMNVMPLIQLALSVKLQPFGRGTLIGCALTVISFGAVPLALRSVLGHAGAGIAASLVVGSVLLGCGLWVFRRPLQLSVMPGVPYLTRAGRQFGLKLRGAAGGRHKRKVWRDGIGM